MKILNILLVALVLTVTNDAFAQRGASQETNTKPVKEQVDTKPTKGQVDIKPTKGKGEISEQAEIQAATTSAEKASEMAEAKAREIDAKVGGITPEQRKRVHSIYESTYTSMRDYKNANPEMAGADLRTEGRKMLKEGHMKAYNVLTPEQQASLGRDGKKADASNKDKAMGRAESQTDELDKVVGLSASQRQEVLALNTDIWEEMKVWKQANPSVAGEEKRMYGKEMNKKRIVGYKSILNEEQINKFIAHREKSPE